MWSDVVKALPSIGLIVSLAGCGAKPRVACEPRLDMNDLAAGLTMPGDAYVLLTDVHTQGRFACSLAIAKLTPRGGDSGHVLALEATKPAEQAYWTEQMRGVSAIRELVFLSPVSVRPDGDSMENLCASAERLGAPLLLVYVANGLGPNSTQVLGVLYDTHKPQALATLHAESTIRNDHGAEVAPDNESGDQRERDARHQAQRSFEQHTLACLRELIHRDTPPSTTQPHKWQQPLIERWWIRTRH